MVLRVNQARQMMSNERAGVKRESKIIQSIKAGETVAARDWDEGPGVSLQHFSQAY